MADYQGGRGGRGGRGRDGGGGRGGGRGGGMLLCSVVLALPPLPRDSAL